MNAEKINTKPDIHILTNGNPLPGSYIIRDGKYFPNPDDEAMVSRSKVKGQRSNDDNEMIDQSGNETENEIKENKEV